MQSDQRVAGSSEGEIVARYRSFPLTRVWPALAQPGVCWMDSLARGVLDYLIVIIPISPAIQRTEKNELYAGRDDVVRIVNSAPLAFSLLVASSALSTCLTTVAQGFVAYAAHATRATPITSAQIGSARLRAVQYWMVGIWWRNRKDC